MVTSRTATSRDRSREEVKEGQSRRIRRDRLGAVARVQKAAVEYLKCANPKGGLAYFVTTYCWTLHVDDPLTGEPTYRKFPCYPYIIEALTYAEKVENFHVEKSRQLLFSWLWMAVFLHDILFKEKWGNVCFSTLQAPEARVSRRAAEGQ